MNLCNTCKHWAPYPADEYGALRGAGECQKTPHLPDVTTLEQDPHDELLDIRVLKPKHAGVLAAVQDGSGYSAKLITMPSFGCVQHEEKAT